MAIALSNVRFRGKADIDWTIVYTENLIRIDGLAVKVEEPA
jgi:hypothetical protein